MMSELKQNEKYIMSITYNKKIFKYTESTGMSFLCFVSCLLFIYVCCCCFSARVKSRTVFGSMAMRIVEEMSGDPCNLIFELPYAGHVVISVTYNWVPIYVPVDGTSVSRWSFPVDMGVAGRLCISWPI